MSSIVPVEATVKYYDDSRILAALQFSLKITEQVFGTVAEDDDIRLDRIFFP